MQDVAVSYMYFDDSPCRAKRRIENLQKFRALLIFVENSHGTVRISGDILWLQGLKIAENEPWEMDTSLTRTMSQMELLY